MPKEIMTLVDRPLVQYAIDKARAVGIKESIFVTSRSKGALEDYFDKAPELERSLRNKGKAKLLSVLWFQDVRVLSRDRARTFLQDREQGAGALIVAQFHADIRITQRPRDQGQSLQMLHTAIQRGKESKHQIDRLTVNGIKINRSIQFDKTAHYVVKIFKTCMGQGDTAPHTRWT
jgi:hypothetical protein